MLTLLLVQKSRESVVHVFQIQHRSSHITQTRHRCCKLMALFLQQILPISIIENFIRELFQQTKTKVTMKILSLYLIVAGLASCYPIELVGMQKESHYKFAKQNNALEILSGLSRNHYTRFVEKSDPTSTLKAKNFQSMPPAKRHDATTDIIGLSRMLLSAQKDFEIQYPSTIVEMPRQLRSKVARDSSLPAATFSATWINEMTDNSSSHYSASGYQSTSSGSQPEKSNFTEQTTKDKSSDIAVTQTSTNQKLISTATAEKYQGSPYPSSSTMSLTSPSPSTSATATVNLAPTTTSESDYNDLEIDIGVTLTIVRVVTVTEDSTEPASKLILDSPTMSTPSATSTFTADLLVTDSIPLQIGQALPSHHHKSIRSTEALEDRDFKSIYILPSDEASAINSEKMLVSRAAHLSVSADYTNS